MKTNVLLIVADDMNYNSLGVTGCKVDNITPNIDKLASQGLRFNNAHVAVAICCPSRQAMMTGRYPHRSGALSNWEDLLDEETLSALRRKDDIFQDSQVNDWAPVVDDVPTLQEQLYKAGYINGIIGKETHLKPPEKFCWDTYIKMKCDDEHWGRDPELYYKYVSEFFEKARNSGKPFFLMANSHDPHRPFANSDMEMKNFGYHLDVNREYSPEEVTVPGFLPDLPDVRKEMAQYYTSVHRCDETVGLVLKALQESGYEEDTLVMFLSDNGASFPFSKTNCYLNSTKTPWIVRWPGKVKCGTVNTADFISGVDFAATILDALGLEQMKGMDGKSFLPLLTGGDIDARDEVFTVLNTTSAKREYPMRCVQNKKFGYIYNVWSDQETVFKNESQGGLTFKAMKDAADNNEEIAKRVKLFQYRVKEEFYDFEQDPDALNNLIDDPKFIEDIKIMRNKLYKYLTDTCDPVAKLFKKEIAGVE